MRLQRQVGPSDTGERIGLTNQTREFRKRIAFGFGGCVRSAAAIIVVAGRKVSVLISLSHRDDASAQG
jgi:hypothetical protein